jgi:hypothetical protein
VKTTNKAPKGAPGKQSADQVSELTTNRLSVYLRCLNVLDAADVKTVSSQALAEQFHLNAAQIRKDLAYFGEFGVRGVGYYVRDLKRHLRQILGLDRKLRVAIMGAGNLGLALADYPGFRQEGFEIAALFDNLSEKVGQQSRGGVPTVECCQRRAGYGRLNRIALNPATGDGRDERTGPLRPAPAADRQARALCLQCRGIRRGHGQ